MIKTIRSLIHEKFDFDLRVELEILSRRRDIVNKEKQQELINILRNHKIEDIVPLGSGTNRYAFKISGFVVKFATDNDGKIDNLKEFKMAKRLYPHVIKVHEVSENGTMLITEYIQPFDSPSEMYDHADEIREILGEMSSTYLIGDVGISDKNFANWGLRIGTNQPVCLDFAYVYEVRSDLFICQYCMTNSMIVPNRDFSKLFCSNSRCGREYSFEDIRRKIGNDIHQHEIGDLKEEGYLMTGSNISIELTTSRSNYLLKKKEGKERSVTKSKDIIGGYQEKSFEITGKSTSHNEEELSMIHEARIKNMIDDISGGINKDKDISNTLGENKRAPGTGFEVSTPTMNQPTIAFSHPVVKINREEDSNLESITQVKVVQKPTVDKDLQGIARVEESIFPDVKDLKGSISKVSNMIKDYLMMKNVFNKISDHLRLNNTISDDFYWRIQNCIFSSLLSYVGIRKDENNNDIFPTISEDMHCLSTILFFERVYIDRNISLERIPQTMMKKYREIYSGDDGIQREWIPILKDRMARKINISPEGIKIIANIIEEFWCSKEIETSDTEFEMEDSDFNSAETLLEMNADIDSELGNDGVPRTFVIQHPNEEEYEDDNEEDDDRETQEFITVDICSENNFDVITIIYPGMNGGCIAIPFYTNLDQLKNVKDLPSMSDDRNGYWDWLIHIQPDIIFTTRDPDKYLAGNSDPDLTYIKCLILDQVGEEYVIGIYYLDPKINLILSKDILRAVNYLVNTEIATSSISHLKRTLTMKDLFRSEEYVLQNLTSQGDDDDEEEDDEEDDSCDFMDDLEELGDLGDIDDLGDIGEFHDTNIKEAAQAAIDFMLSSMEENSVETIEESEEESEDESEYEDEDDSDYEEESVLDTTVISMEGSQDNQGDEYTFTPITKKKSYDTE